MEAHCAAGSAARCPGGVSANGNTDPTLCDGAPVYQNGGGFNGGYVLLRVSEDGGTRWYVSDPACLADCEFHGYYSGESESGNLPGYIPRSDLSPGRPGYAPTAPAYGQWSTPSSHESISVVAGGGR